MKNLIRAFFRNYFISIGIAASFVAFFCYIVKSITPQHGMHLLAVIIVAMIPCIFCFIILFRPGLSKHILWLHRAIAIIIAGTLIPLFYIVLGVKKYTDPTDCLIYVVIHIFIVGICCIITYIIGDKIEERKIKKINEHLKKNN